MMLNLWLTRSIHPARRCVPAAPFSRGLLGKAQLACPAAAPAVVHAHLPAGAEHTSDGRAATSSLRRGKGGSRVPQPEQKTPLYLNYV